MTRQAWIISTVLLAWATGFFSVDASAQQPFTWERIGGPFGGYLSALTEDPHTGNLWTSVSNNGLYVSSDGGDTWTERGGSPLSASAFAFRADGTIFAGRWRSDNQGHSWLKTGFPDSTYARTFALDDATGNVIASTRKGLYVSTDNGDTWTHTSSGYTERLVATDQGFVFALADVHAEASRLLRSGDGGASWEHIQLPPQQLPSGIVTGPDDKLYLSLIDDNYPYRTSLYVSSDQGDTWEEWLDVSSFFHCSRARDLLGFDATGQLFLANDERVIRLSADLNTCTAIFSDSRREHEASGWSRYRSLRAAMLDVRDHLFVTSGFGGPYRSRDGGETWEFLEKTGIPASNVWSVFVEEQTGVLWAGTSKDGLFRSDDQGQTWNRRPGFETKNIIDLTAGATPDELWAATLYDGLFHSSDAGATWTYVPHDDVKDVPFNLHYAPASQTLFVHYPVYDIYYTQDRGQTWRPMNVPINNRIDPPLTAMAVGAEEEVYAAVLEPLELTFVIYRTRDLGQTWEALNADFPGLDPYDAYWGVRLLVDSADTLWAIIRNTIYYTADEGATWNRATDIPGIPYTFIESPDGALWIGHNEGVHRSTDRGRTWHALDDGLTHRSVNFLAWDPYTGDMLAGTLTGGVFRGRQEEQPVLVVEQEKTPGLVHDIRLVNYPNPFDHTTTIAFDLPHSGPVRLTLYDLLGRAITRLLDQPLQEGPHRIAVDGSHLSQGIYVYRLQTPSGTFVQQMIRVR